MHENEEKMCVAFFFFNGHFCSLFTSPGNARSCRSGNEEYVRLNRILKHLTFLTKKTEKIESTILPLNVLTLERQYQGSIIGILILVGQDRIIGLVDY